MRVKNPWLAIRIVCIFAILSTIGMLVTDPVPEDEALESDASQFPHLEAQRFDRWREFATEHNCSLRNEDYSQIYRDLEPWIQARSIKASSVVLARNLLEANAKASDSGAQKRKKVIVSVITFENATFSHSHLSHVLQPLAKLLPPHAQFTFIATHSDYPSVLPANDRYAGAYASVQDVLDHNNCLRLEHSRLVQESHGFFLEPAQFTTLNALVPVFSRAKPACYVDILFPSDYHFGNFKPTMADPVSWNDKKQVLFWRGSATGGSYKDSDLWKQYHRTRLLDWERKFAGKNPGRVFDAGVEDSPSSELCVDVGLKGDLTGYSSKSFVPFTKTMEFRYLLVVDGNSWPDRLQRYLASNSVVLYAGIFIDYFMWKLEPWVHYIPVSVDFSDLDKRLKWLEENEEMARQISLNAQALVWPISTIEAMQCYLGLLLSEYSQLYQVDI
ncbi:glycosyl transferase family 90-domain-containing protein [Chytriomyces sp. MP71]|nr:glycosyl transferase family 90-domain-containing protein [Chytriomyces sp. MP71]